MVKTCGVCKFVIFDVMQDVYLCGCKDGSEYLFVVSEKDTCKYFIRKEELVKMAKKEKPADKQKGKPADKKGKK